MVSFIDTHAHYTDPRFEEAEGGAAALLSDPAFRAVTRAIVNVGTNLENSRAAVRQAAADPRMVAAVGIHPSDAQEAPGGPLDPDRTLAALRALVADPAARRRDKIAAIGEIGLDRHLPTADRPLQQRFFEGQLALAAELGLPVIVHDREAHGACFETILRYPSVTGVFHAYSGSVEMERELTRRGWYVAFGGTVTFRNAARAREAAAVADASRLLLETDCPYLAPEPFRGRLCHSALIPYAAEVIARLRGVSVEELAEVTSRNAETLFRLRTFLPDL